jgi:hypothetical protein
MEQSTRVGQGSNLLAIPDGQIGIQRLNRRGESVNNRFELQSAIDGRVFVASAGTLTTPITFTSTAAIDGTKAAFFLAVPVGYTVIPLEIVCYMEAFGTTAQFEIMASCGTGGVTAGATTVGITNIRTDAPFTSQCTAGSDLTGATYMTTNVSEFWRDGQQFTVTKSAGSATASVYDPAIFRWRVADAAYAPVLVGASQLGVFIGSQAGTGFVKCVFAEYPSIYVV